MSKTNNKKRKITSLEDEELERRVKTTKRTSFILFCVGTAKTQSRKQIESLDSINNIPDEWAVEIAELKAEKMRRIRECDQEFSRQTLAKSKGQSEEELDLIRKLAPHVDYPRLEGFDVSQLSQLVEITKHGLAEDTVYALMNKKIKAWGGFVI